MHKRLFIAYWPAGSGASHASGEAKSTPFTSSSADALPGCQRQISPG